MVMKGLSPLLRLLTIGCIEPFRNWAVPLVFVASCNVSGLFRLLSAVLMLEVM